mmetsp:Transcript_87225/g.244781  ORF Transcript_87225/g.244781 Transcript_87225/m.244781 type:complete len:338 (+) Transcript_87225:1000-2013(+)
MKRVYLPMVAHCDGLSDCREDRRRSSHWQPQVTGAKAAPTWFEESRERAQGGVPCVPPVGVHTHRRCRMALQQPRQQGEVFGTQAVFWAEGQAAQPRLRRPFIQLSVAERLRDRAELLRGKRPAVAEVPKERVIRREAIGDAGGPVWHLRLSLRVLRRRLPPGGRLAGLPHVGAVSWRDTHTASLAPAPEVQPRRTDAQAGEGNDQEHAGSKHEVRRDPSHVSALAVLSARLRGRISAGRHLPWHRRRRRGADAGTLLGWHGLRVRRPRTQHLELLTVIPVGLWTIDHDAGIIDVIAPRCGVRRAGSPWLGAHFAEAAAIGPAPRAILVEARTKHGS